MVYISPDPFRSAFKEELDLRKFDLSHHRTAGLCFFEKDGRLFLASMAPSTPGARIPRWQTRIRGAWLITINGTSVSLISDAQGVFQQLWQLALCRAPYSSHTRKLPQISPTRASQSYPRLTSPSLHTTN
jgi:hypothetical protein